MLEVPSAPATRISGGSRAELRGDRGLLVDPLETGNRGQGLFEMDIVLTEADRQRHRRGVTGENDRICVSTHTRTRTHACTHTHTHIHGTYCTYVCAVQLQFIPPSLLLVWYSISVLYKYMHQ